MKGLFDLLNSDDPAVRQGLLQAGLSLLGSKGNFGNALGQAGMAGLLGSQQFRDRQSQQERQKMQDQMLRSKFEAEQQQRAALQGLPSPTMLASQSALSGGGGPTAENAAKIRPVDPRAAAMHPLVQAGVIAPDKYLETLDPNYGREEVNQWLETQGGRQAVNRFGDPVGGKVPFAPDISLVNLGDKIMALDKRNATPGQSFGVGMSPTERDSSARGWQSLRQAQEFEAARSAREAAAAAQKKPSDKDVRVAEANDALALLDQAGPLIDKSTSSYVGAGIDQAARLVGASTSGAQAAAQLKALEGALISKMPKMSGPQSDKDVLLYKQMAGQIGDPTIPAKTKKAAVETIREINQRHAGGQAAGGPAKIGSDEEYNKLPSGAEFIGPDGKKRRKP